MKKIPWKHIMIILTLGVGVYVAIEMYKAYQNFKADIAAGTKTFMDVLLAPWNTLVTAASAVKSAVVSSTPYQGAVALTQLPLLTATEQQNAAAQDVVAGSYQPGGAMYQTIASTQGTAAANAAATAASNNAATESAQAAADSSWSTSPWNPTTWFS